MVKWPRRRKQGKERERERKMREQMQNVAAFPKSSNDGSILPCSVTEESRLQSILAISVVSTKNASLQSQSHFDYDEATIR
jgi:hypothetical protein